MGGIHYFSRLFRIKHEQMKKMLIKIELFMALLVILGYLLNDVHNLSILVYIQKNYGLFIFGYLIYIFIVLLNVLANIYIKPLNILINNNRFIRTIFVLIYSSAMFYFIKDLEVFSKQEIVEMNKMNWNIISVLIALTLIIYFGIISRLKDKKTSIDNPYIFNNEVEIEFISLWLIGINFLLLNVSTISIYIFRIYSEIVIYMSIFSFILTMNILLESVFKFNKIIYHQKENVLFDKETYAAHKTKFLKKLDDLQEMQKIVFSIDEHELKIKKRMKRYNRLKKKSEKVSDKLKMMLNIGKDKLDESELEFAIKLYKKISLLFDKINLESTLIKEKLDVLDKEKNNLIKLHDNK